MRLTQVVEALLFASDAPLAAADLARVDERLDEDTVAAVVEELKAAYNREERSFQVYEVAGGYQLLSRPEYVSVLERYETVPQTARLSNPALEVLAIIAYRQPIGRAEVEEIRGVGSSGVLRTLQDRGLVEPVGRAEGLGRPHLYGTTRRFLEHVGFDSLEDLPRPEDLPVVLRERPAEIPTEDASDDAAHAPPHDHDPSPNPLPAHAEHPGPHGEGATGGAGEALPAASGAVAAGVQDEHADGGAPAEGDDAQEGDVQGGAPTAAPAEGDAAPDELPSVDAEEPVSSGRE